MILNEHDDNDGGTNTTIMILNEHEDDNDGGSKIKSENPLILCFFHGLCVHSGQRIVLSGRTLKWSAFKAIIFLSDNNCA